MAPPAYKELSTFTTVNNVRDVNGAMYLVANPDVAAAGLDPTDHFARYGKCEGRMQYHNLDAISQLRKRKLRGVSFRNPTHAEPDSEGRLNLLPESVRRIFEIPDQPPEAANNYADELIKLIQANPKSAFLDVGAGVRHTYYSNVINTEIWGSVSTGMVCVGEDLPFSDNQFDHVFCLAVLEHTKQPWIAAEELIRVTKPGGTIRVDWPFLQPVHGYPHHFYNATPKGNQSMFEDRCDIISCDVRVWQHPVFGLSWILKEWHAGLSEAEREGFRNLRVGELIGDLSATQELVCRSFSEKLSLDAQRTSAAGTTLTVRKKVSSG